MNRSLDPMIVLDNATLYNGCAIFAKAVVLGKGHFKIWFWMGLNYPTWASGIFAVAKYDYLVVGTHCMPCTTAAKLRE